MNIGSELFLAAGEATTGAALLVGLGAVSLAWTLGYLWGGTRARRVLRAIQDEHERAARRTEQQSHRLQSEIASLQDENTEIQNLLRWVPELSQRLSASEDIDITCEQIISILQTMVPARRVCVFLAREEGYVPWMGTGIDKGLLRTQVIPFGHGKIGWAGERALVTYASQIKDQTRLVRSQVLDEDEVINADVYIPLVHHGDALGMITLEQLDRRPRFERQILGALKDLFSTALAGNRAFEEVSHRANRDGLTGLYNMTFFRQHFEIEISKARRSGGTLAVFMLDIDHFKHYNDTHGHMAGDEVLRRVGRLFKEHTRAVDVAARYGGEEFIVLAPGLTRDEAMQFAERFRTVFLAHPFPHKETQPTGTMSFSGGIAAYPIDGLTVDDLIRAADSALYIAKRNNRNQVVQASGPVPA